MFKFVNKYVEEDKQLKAFFAQHNYPYPANNKPYLKQKLNVGPHVYQTLINFGQIVANVIFDGNRFALC